MPNTTNIPAYCLIPLSSDEPLWEWDLVSDSLFLSHGARKSLNLQTPPKKMAAFYELLPPDAAIELASLRESAISGRAGSTLECSYLCNGLWTNEFMLVISRNVGGRATRVLGRFKATPVMPPDTGFRGGPDTHQETGVWVYNVPQGTIRRDRICSAILGRQNERERQVDAASALLAIHPEDRGTIKRHYQLFCEGPYLGDYIVDLARIRQENGGYAQVSIRASVLERDASGKAILIAGQIAPSNPDAAGTVTGLKDDKLFHALNSLGSGQWNWDTKNDIMYFCSRYIAILGYTQDDSADFAQNWRDYIHPDDVMKVNKAQLEVITGTENGDSYECTYRMKRADGGWAWIFDRGCVTWRNKEGIAGHMIGSITNITTSQAERDRLEELVRHDSLTGLRSRAYLNLEMEHIEQNRIRPVCVISVDVNGLKMVNDYLGHSMGDELLTKAASILRNCLRATDCIARTGGDEFLVLLPNCDAEKGEKLLKKIRVAFDAYNDQGHHMPIFAALGMAATNDPLEEMDHLIGRADAEMYADKKEMRPKSHAVIKEWILNATGKEVGVDDRLT